MFQRTGTSAGNCLFARDSATPVGALGSPIALHLNPAESPGGFILA